MQVEYRRCCGLDVSKDSIMATIFVFQNDGEREVSGASTGPAHALPKRRA